MESVDYHDDALDEVEPIMIEPDCTADDFWGESVTFVGIYC